MSNRHQHIVQRLRQNMDLSHLDDDQIDQLAERVGDLASGMWVPDDYAVDAITAMMNSGLDRARELERGLARLNARMAAIHDPDVLDSMTTRTSGNDR